MGAKMGDTFCFISSCIFIFKHVDMCPIKRINDKRRQMMIVYTLQDIQA